MSPIRPLLALASLLAFTGACFAQGSGLSPEDLYEKVAPSVWLVETRDTDGKGSLGSAVVIGPTDLITNCHVVGKAEVIAVSHGGPRMRARLRYRDPERDLCQLAVEGLDAPVVEIAEEASLRVGAKVYAIGNPSGLTLTLSDGLLSGLRRDRTGKLQAVQMTVPISPGSSGGGLFDVHGRLVGVVTFHLKDTQNLNFALPATWVAELPQRAGGTPVARVAPRAAPKAPAPATAPPVAPAAPVAPAPVAPAPDARLAPVAPAPPAAPAASPPAGAMAPPAAAPMDLRDLALVPGSVLVYRLRDRLSGGEQEVAYRLDRIEGERLVFNGGARIELAGGEVVNLKAVIGGEYEQAMPPEGWVTARSIHQSRWQTTYLARGDGRPFRMELNAEVADEQVLQLKGRQVQTVAVRFKGYTTRGGGLSGTNPSASYAATAWYAPALGRVVRFEARTRGGSGGAAFLVDESLELEDVRRP